MVDVRFDSVACQLRVSVFTVFVGGSHPDRAAPFQKLSVQLVLTLR